MQQITNEQRYTIKILIESGYSKQKIASSIGKHKSSVYREIKRNRDGRSLEYKPLLAEKKCRERHESKAKKIGFTNEIKAQVDSLLEEDYSPEQVVGYCKKNGIPCVSVERIYQDIWEDKKQGGDLHTHLRRKGRKYRNRGSQRDTRGIIIGRIGIEKRPEIVEKRERFGDLEVDLIIGKNHKQAIVTINDRASGILKMQKVESKEAEVVTRAINNLLEEWIPYLHTITADNGKEFAGHKDVSEFLNIDYYFARPYHSWERGSNENLNGLIRQYFTKGSDFRNISNQRIKEVEFKLNSRPRKRLNFETPIFVMDQLLFNQKVAFVA